MAVVRQDVVKIGFDVDMRELNRLSDELDGVRKTVTGGIGGDAFDEMIKESGKAAEGLDGIKDSLKGVDPDGVDEMARELKNAGGQAGETHKKLNQIAKTGFDKTVSGLKKMGGALGNVAKEAGKALAKALSLSAVGVGAMITGSVGGYADYEQLIGGVDTLFGTGGRTFEAYAQSLSASKAEIKAFQKAHGLAVDGIVGPQTQAALQASYEAMEKVPQTVLQNANNAWKNSGLSANAYMETVTSFSASLIQSLGGDTEKAAAYAETAIVDMADNANKMGSDLGSIQDAYQGFAKQNYTMLDNLGKMGALAA